MGGAPGQLMENLSPARPDVSVVIPWSARWQLTERCLASLLPALEQSRASVEVVYVDDASEDQTVEELSSRHRSLRVLRSAQA